MAGVGAGFGYRFMDLLRLRNPDWQHMALGGVGSLGIQNPGAAAARLGALDLDRLVYAMNLNDVLPTLPGKEHPGPAASGEESAAGATASVPSSSVAPSAAPVVAPPHPLIRLGLFARKYTDWLRGRSYLYTWVRTRIKLVLTRMGYEYHGMQAFELFPERNASAFEDTCVRVRAFAEFMEERGTRFEVLLLPYEMQISEQAAKRYADLGIEWEPGFELGSAQARLQACLDGLVVHDSLAAFVERPEDRTVHAVGEYFVYNHGDKLDWNHPNRKGHVTLAEFLDERLVWLGGS
ncbi:MAG: hypothetical protein VX614_03925 [Myxococcota bacterium]|nr:hypothetical protein [Myxococcota bacterium]